MTLRGAQGPSHPDDGSLYRLAAARHKAKSVARTFLDRRGYFEVETPSVVVCPGLDAHVHSLGRVIHGGKTSFLITSPELHMKRLIAFGVGRIYQLAHCFRAEELGTWHEPEFLMLEWYRTGASLEDLMTETEELVRDVALALAPAGVLERPDIGASADIQRPFLRLSVSEAFDEFAGVKDVARLAEENVDEYFQLMVDRVEPGLAGLGQPACLTHYPLCQAGLARSCPDRPGYAERFELYAAGVELCNGFAELTDPKEQRRRFEAELVRRARAKEPVYPIDEDFLAALELGMPETAGNALGFDRLIALALGAGGLRDAVLFPSLPG